MLCLKNYISVAIKLSPILCISAFFFREAKVKKIMSAGKGNLNKWKQLDLMN